MKIQSFNDVVTNSSSELFVFSKNNYKEVSEVISKLDEIYPEWKTEYENPKKIKDATDQEIERLVIYAGYYDLFGLPNLWNCEVNYYSQKIFHDEEHCSTYYFRSSDFDRNDCALKKFAESWGATPEELFSNWNIFNPFADSSIESERKFYPFVKLSDKFFDIIREKFGNEILLFSLDENPDWEYQEMIEDVATRIHLG